MRIEKYLFWLVLASFLLTTATGAVFITRPSFKLIFTLFNLNVDTLFTIFLISYIFFLPLYYYSLINQRTKEVILTTKLIFLFSLGVYFSRILFNLLETQKYANYVYSKFHIFLPHLDGYANFQLLNIFLYLIIVYKKFSSKLELALDKINLRKVFILIVYVILCIIVTQITLRMPDILLFEYKNLIKVKNSELAFSNISVDLEKFSEKALFLKNHIPKNATVIHPRQSAEFPDIGNQVLLRYYLYPRTLVSPVYLQDFLKDHNSNSCDLYSILAVNLEAKKVFPDYEVNSEYVAVYGSDKVTRITNYEKFNNTVLANLDDFEVGIIKHKQCKL